MSNAGKAKDLAHAFQRMSKPMSKGGTGGTFTAAAARAGHPDTPAGRKAYAGEVLNNPDEYSGKLRRKAQFYRNVISR